MCQDLYLVWANRDDSKRWKASSKEPLPTWKVRRNLSLKAPDYDVYGFR